MDLFGWKGCWYCKVVIWMLLGQVNVVVGVMECFGLKFGVWVMSQVVLMLMKWVDGWVLVWMWKVEFEFVVVMVIVQVLMLDVCIVCVLMLMDYDDIELFLIWFGVGEKLFVLMLLFFVFLFFVIYIWDIGMYLIMLMVVCSDKEWFGIFIGVFDDFVCSICIVDDLIGGEFFDVLCLLFV